MKDNMKETGKKPKSPLTFAILATVFAGLAVLCGGVGLLIKLIELVAIIPGFIMFGLGMMVYGFLIAIPLYIPVVNVIFVIGVALLFVFMACCAVGWELLPFVLCLFSLFFAVIAIVKAFLSHSKNGKSGVTAISVILSAISVVISFVLPTVLMLPAIIWILAKVGVNVAGIVVFVRLLIMVLTGAG